MDDVEKIKAAILDLASDDFDRFCNWFDEYYEQRLDLTDEVKLKLDEARAEIHAGNYRTRKAF